MNRRRSLHHGLRIALAATLAATGLAAAAQPQPMRVIVGFALILVAILISETKLKFLRRRMA